MRAIVFQNSNLHSTKLSLFCLKFNPMAAITLTIKDETSAGATTNEVAVSFDSELSTVKDIIRNRVLAEVTLYNNKLPEYFKGLVQPGEAERTLNGYKLKARARVDPEKQLAAAFKAFENNGFFILIDNIQSTGLEQMVVITSATRISFIKLTQLVGG